MLDNITSLELETENQEGRSYELAPRMLVLNQNQMIMIQKSGSHEVEVAILASIRIKILSILSKERTQQQITLSGMNMPLKLTNKRFSRQAKVVNATSMAIKVTVVSQLKD